MTSRTLLLFPAVLAVIGGALAACGESRERAPAVPDCPPGITCATGPGVVGGPGDAGGDALTDALFDGDAAGVTVTGFVRPINTSFTDDPSTVTAGVSPARIRADRLGGGITEADTIADGSFTLNDVAPGFTVPTWLTVLQGGSIRSLVGLGLPTPSTTPFALPLYGTELPLTTWNTVVSPGVGTLPTGSGTVVVHVVDVNSGSPRQGITASAVGTGQGPFYDDGVNVRSQGERTSTGARGTIVFLGIVGAPTVGVALQDGMRAYGTITVPVAANAVSYLTVGVE